MTSSMVRFQAVIYGACGPSFSTDAKPGRFKGVERMVTHRIGLDDVVAGGLEMLLKGRAECVKILVSAK